MQSRINGPRESESGEIGDVGSRVEIEVAGQRFGPYRTGLERLLGFQPWMQISLWKLWEALCKDS